MSKDKKIIAVDNIDFKSSVSGTKPLKQDKHHFLPPALPKRPGSPPHAKMAPRYWLGIGQDLLEKIHPDDWLTARDYIHFARDSVAHRRTKQLAAGKLSPWWRIDLHGMQADQALLAVQTAIDDATVNGYTVLHVIHGKGGISGQREAVLKNALHQWLPSMHPVLAYCSCTPKHGGTGALFVLIRQGKI